MTAPVIIVEAPSDVPASRIGRLARPDLSKIVITPGSSHTTTGGVAADVLNGLGKQFSANGKARHNYDDTILVPLWLSAHHTTDVYAVAPQHTPAAYLLDLAAMLSASPATLWLACDHGYAQAVSEAVAATGPEIRPWPDCQPSSDPTETDDEDSGRRWDPQQRPVLPDTEFLTFYATAQRLLDPADFEAVSVLYRDILSRTLTWIDQVEPADVTEHAAHTALSSMLEEQATLDDIHVASKAAQAAFFRRDWYLNVDSSELRAGLLRFPHPHVDAATWLLPRAYRDTARAATVALHLAGMTAASIKALTVADLCAWQSAPSTPLAGTPIPPPAWPYLVAHTLARASDGPASSEPGFVGSDRRVLMDLREAVSDLGLNLGEANLHEEDRLGQRRIGSRVFRLVRLT